MDGKGDSRLFDSPTRSRRNDRYNYSNYRSPRNVTWAPTSNIIPNSSSSELFENSLASLNLPEWGDSMENVRLLKKQLQVVQDIRAELGRKNAVIGNLRAEKDALQQRCHLLQAAQERANHLEQRCAHLSSELANCQGRSAELDGRSQVLERKLREDDQQITHLDEILANKEKAIATLEVTLASTKEELADLKALYDREHQQKKELERMSVQVEDNLNEALVREKETVRQLEKELAITRQDLADNKAKVQILVDIKHQKEDLEKQLGNMHQDYKTAMDVNNQSREQAKNEVQELTLELRDVRNRYSLLEDDHRAMASLLQAKEEVILQMDHENNRRLGVDDQLRRCQSENEQLQNKILELTGRLGSFDGTLREFRALIRGQRNQNANPAGSHQGSTTLRLGTPGSGRTKQPGNDSDNSQLEFSTIEAANSVLLELNDLLKEVNGLKARCAEADQLERSVMELKQKLNQDKITNEELTLKLSILEQRSTSLEEEVGGAKQNAASRGNFLENILHQLRIAGVGVPDPLTPVRGDTNDMFVFISQGVQQLLQVNAEATLLRQKLVEAEALIDALRTEISEENNHHKKEMRKITERHSKEAEAFRSKYEGQVAQVIQASKAVETNMRGSKKKQAEKIERIEGKMKNIIHELEEENSILKLQLKEERHQATQNTILLDKLEQVMCLLACGTVPLAHRCRDLVGQKAFMARETNAYLSLHSQLSALASSVASQEANGQSDLTPRGTRPVEPLLEWNQNPATAEYSADVRLRPPPSFRAVVIAVVAAHRLVVFARESSEKKVHYPRRFPFSLLTEEGMDPCSSAILDVHKSLEGWLQVVQAFGDQKDLSNPSLSFTGRGFSGLESNLVVDLSMGLQQHQRRLWDRGLLSNRTSQDGSTLSNRVSKARNQRYAAFGATFQTGGLALVGVIRRKLAHVSSKATDAEALCAALSRQLEACTSDEMRFKDNLDNERKRLSKLKKIFNNLEQRGAVREAALEEELRDKDRRLQDLENRLRRALEKAESMQEARDRVQEELFQLHAYMKRSSSQDVGKDEQHRQLPRASHSKSSRRKSKPRKSPSKEPGNLPPQPKTQIRIDSAPNFRLDLANHELNMPGKDWIRKTPNEQSHNMERSVIKAQGKNDLSGLYALSPLVKKKPEVSLRYSKELTNMEQKLEEQANLAQEISNLARKADRALKLNDH